MKLQIRRKCFILELPTDITFDILSRLPIKTLFHCRVVCKGWQNIISNSDFAKLHLSRSPVSLLLKPIYLHTRSFQLHLIDFDLQIIHSQYPREARLKLKPFVNIPIVGKIINSCNGLLCLYGYDNHVHVCNPVTGDYITIPRSRYNGNYGRRNVAFGFCPKTSKYKVVQFSYQRSVFDPTTKTYKKPEEADVEIYTLGEGSWRDIGGVPCGLTKHSFNAFVNGALHWLTFSRENPDFISCFDFVIENVRVIPEPPEFDQTKKGYLDWIQLCVLQDSLSLCDFTNSLHMDIWIMKQYGIKESWNKEFVIKKVIIQNWELDFYEPIMILKSGDILILCNKNALMLYTPKFGTFQKLNTFGVKSKFCAAAHITSFVSLEDVAKGERLTRLMLES